jgi:hypothetical protein
MVKRKAESQIGNLTPDHKKSGIDLISLRLGGVRHAVGKFSTRAITFVQTSSHRKSIQEVIALQSCGSSNLGNFGTPETKNHLDEGFTERCIIYYMGEGGESCESEVACGES